MGLLVALVGFVVVEFAYQFRMPDIQLSPEIDFWINGGVALTLILVGMTIVVARR
jgi:hypothetical protein